MKNSSIKAQRSGFVNQKTLIATVDINKNTNAGYFLCPDGNEVKPFEFTNNIDGLNKFLDIAMMTKTRYGLEEIIVGFESTGCYSQPLINFMKDKPVILVQVNPMHTKKMKEVTDNSPNKTDKKDPRVIADIVRLGRYLSVVIPEGAAAELRELTLARENQKKHKTALLNRLETLMFKIFPEFVQIIGRLSTKTALYLIERYPTPDRLKELTLSELSQMIKRISRGRFKESKAKRLLEAARDSVGTREGLSSILMEIEYTLSQLKQTEKFISQLKERIQYWVYKIPYHKGLLSIKGIGIITVGGVIGEIGDFRNFRNQSEIMKFAGLNLYEVSSGKHKGKIRISKRGRGLLRMLLYFAVLNTVKKGGIFHDYYQRLIARGTNKISVLVAISKKLLRLMFALVRDNSCYIQSYKPIRRKAA